MSNKIYVGDIGTIIEVDCIIDISGATVGNVLIEKPDGSTATWTATVTGTLLKCVTEAGDLSVPGVYTAQAYVEIYPTKVKGESASFTVYDSYE